jgi:hypothetical protein
LIKIHTEFGKRKNKHFTSAFGEHVIAFEVEEAIKATLKNILHRLLNFIWHHRLIQMKDFLIMNG